ncbi:MAG: Fmu (Sun) domain-containing protein, partial [Pedobacter sp.]
VVQDYSSQQTGKIIFEHINDQPKRIWDCCAASGGKTIMLHDLFPSSSLIVSDIRESILINLRKRFQQANISSYRSFVADLSNDEKKIPLQSVELVIADLPCSGSGTWGRNPEQLIYFDPARIDYYATLQQRILQTIKSFVARNGYLVYITCSVYKKENESNLEELLKDNSLELVHQQLLIGYPEKADSMFVAIVRKS